MAENRGGARIGAGRKPKSDELKLIEKLSPYDDTAIDMLTRLVGEGDFNALKLFFEYRFGKPTQKVESDSNVNINTISLKDLVSFE